MTREIATIIMLAAALIAYVGWFTWTVHYGPAVDSDHGYQVVNLRAMGNFDLDGRSTTATVPPTFAALDGRKVVLDGFVHDPRSASDRTASFQLVFDLMGDRGPPKVQERLFCTVTGGRTIERPDAGTAVRTFGVLHVGVRRDDAGWITSVYRLDVDRVEPVR